MMSEEKKKYRILIEASKIYQKNQDGVKRYLDELIRELYFFNQENKEFEIDLLLGRNIFPLEKLNLYNDNELHISIDTNQYVANFDWEMKNFKMGMIMNILYPFLKMFFPFNYKARLGIVTNFGFLGNLAVKIYYTQYQKRYYPVMLTMLTRLGKGRYTSLEKKIEKYDLVHVPLPQNLLFFKTINTSFLVTLHDISHKLFPEFHTKDNIRRSEKGITLSKEKNTHYIAVSESTLNDVKRYYSINNNKLKKIHGGVDLNKFKYSEKWDGMQLEEKYFLCLATLEPRKNLLNTIAAFEKLIKETKEEIYLIVIGGGGWRNRKIKKELKISSDKIVFKGFVEDDEIPIYYSNAIALVYPSFYEGFGLPLLESMACGTPVIYGNNSSMPEVTKGVGVPVNPNDINSIKNGMLSLLDKNNRKELSQKGLKIAKLSSWNKMAIKTLEYYKEICSKISNVSP